MMVGFTMMMTEESVTTTEKKEEHKRQIFNQGKDMGSGLEKLVFLKVRSQKLIFQDLTPYRFRRAGHGGTTFGS